MHEFRAACGASGPLQFRVEGPGAPEGGLCRCETPFLVVGQDPKSDLLLTHKDVSPRHLYLQVLSGRLYCADLGSSTGTFVDGVRHRSGWVGQSQTIRIGPSKIRLIEGARPEEALAPSALEEQRLPRLDLEIKLRGIRSVRSQIHAGLSLIGSAADCQLRLLDPSVTNYHCALVNTPDGTWVVDLLGQDGIRVNGTIVRSARVDEGDELLLGRTALRWKILAGENLREAAAAQAALAPAPPVPVPALVPVPVPALVPVPTAAPAPAPESTPVAPPERAPARVEVMTRHAKSERRAGIREVVPVPARVDDPDALVEHANDRRGSCRYPVSEIRAQLSWWELVKIPVVVEKRPTPSESCTYSAVMARGPGFRNGAILKNGRSETSSETIYQERLNPRHCPVQLVDVSQTGLSAMADVAPPIGERVWFRLENGVDMEWIEVVPVGDAPTPQGLHLVRLAFREACPYDVFKALVLENKIIRV